MSKAIILLSCIFLLTFSPSRSSGPGTGTVDGGIRGMHGSITESFAGIKTVIDLSQFSYAPQLLDRYIHVMPAIEQVSQIFKKFIIP